MKCQQFYLPRSGKLVTQLPGGITFAYEIHLGHSKDRWKGPAEEYNDELEVWDPKTAKKTTNLKSLF